VKYDDVKYAINIPGHALYVPGKTGKNVDQGYIDCSGWVGTLQNRTMDEINQKAGHAVFSKADRIDLGNLGSGGIVRKAVDQSGVLLDRDAILKPGALKEGMIIGLDTARTRHEHWNGIDHIVMVVRDPNTDKLLISQSTGSKGVHTMPVEDYLKQVKDHPNWKLYASDPLSKARDLLENRTQSHEQTQGKPAAEHKAAAARTPSCTSRARTARACARCRSSWATSAMPGPTASRWSRTAASAAIPKRRCASCRRTTAWCRRHCRCEDAGGDQGGPRAPAAERRAAPAQSDVHPGQPKAWSGCRRAPSRTATRWKAPQRPDQGGACRRPAAHRRGGAQPER
jgi:hypothetical protein